MTGSDLAAELDTLLAGDPKLSKWRIGKIVYGCKCGVETIRRRLRVLPLTVERVRALCANPPPEAYAKPLGRPAQPKAPRAPRKIACHRRPITEAHSTKMLAGIKRSQRAQAKERIAQGLDSASASPGVRITQRYLEKQAADMARIADPVEQAKLKLRRNNRVVFSESVYGGRKDRFIVSGRGRESISTAELMALAATIPDCRA